MRYVSFLLLLGMMMGQELVGQTSGSAEGQLRCISGTADELRAKCVLEETHTCDDKIRFNRSEKLIRDIFPEECGTGIVNPGPLNDIPLNKREAQWDVGTAAAHYFVIPTDAETVISGHAWKLSELQPFYLAAPQKPDPPDVPAVKKSRTVPSNCNTILPGDNLVMPYRRLSCFPADEDYWTCADPTRGLWHDQVPEPKTKWYCRKAQTE